MTETIAVDTGKVRGLWEYFCDLRDSVDFGATDEMHGAWTVLEALGLAEVVEGELEARWERNVR